MCQSSPLQNVLLLLLPSQLLSTPIAEPQAERVGVEGEVSDPASRAAGLRGAPPLPTYPPPGLLLLLLPPGLVGEAGRWGHWSPSCPTSPHWPASFLPSSLATLGRAEPATLPVWGRGAVDTCASSSLACPACALHFHNCHPKVLPCSCSGKTLPTGAARRVGGTCQAGSGGPAGARSRARGLVVLHAWGFGLLCFQCEEDSCHSRTEWSVSPGSELSHCQQSSPVRRRVLETRQGPAINCHSMWAHRTYL